MDNTRLLYDAYNSYYEKGTTDLINKNFKSASRNLYLAAETLLKLAKESEGQLKVERTKKAEELFNLASEVEKKILNKDSRSSALNDLQKFTNGNEGKSSKEDESLTQFTPAEDTGVSLDDVAGLEEAKEEIRKKVLDPIKYPELYSKFKKKKGGGILLYGLPGTGKTMLAQAVAHEIDAKFFAIKCSDISSKWFGDSEKNLKNLFAEARKYPISIIFFDEFEAIGTKRSTYSTVMKRVVPELLEQMQGFEKFDNILLVIAATNRPNDIDSAFLRPGRFDRRIYVPLPDEEAREKIITKQFANVPISEDFDYTNLAKRTDGFNGADVFSICEKIKDLAIQRSIAFGKESYIQNSDAEKALETTFSSVVPDDLKEIVAYQKQQRD